MNGESVFGFLLSFSSYGSIALKPFLSILTVPLIIIGSFGIALIIDEFLFKSKLIEGFAKKLGSSF